LIVTKIKQILGDRKWSYLLSLCMKKVMIYYKIQFIKTI
jgi:hypothetical protein